MVELLHTTWGLLLWPRLAVYQPIWWRERVMARKQRVVGQEEPTVTWCAILLAHLELLNVETHLHQGRLQLSICSHSVLPGMASGHLRVDCHPRGSRCSLWDNLYNSFTFAGSLLESIGEL